MTRFLKCCSRLLPCNCCLAILTATVGCATTTKPLPRKAWTQWTQIQPCISGPDPYNNGIPGGTSYRWFSRATADGLETWVGQLPYWPEGCKRFDVDLDGDVDMKDLWRLLP